MNFVDNFKTQPVSVVFVTHEDFDDEYKNDPLDVVDSNYAVMGDEQYENWIKIFNNISTPDYEDEFTLCARFKVDEGNFVMISDGGDEIGGEEFRNFCGDNKIDCQFDIDCPIISDEDGEPDWNNTESLEGIVYTGAGEDFPEILKIMYRLQHGEV